MYGYDHLHGARLRPRFAVSYDVTTRCMMWCVYVYGWRSLLLMVVFIGCLASTTHCVILDVLLQRRIVRVRVIV